MDTVNETLLLHVLATEPSRVLPPGKSLLSMLTTSGIRVASSTTSTPLQQIHARVEQAVHDVFWDEAIASISSPSPAKQLSRLKLLYSDLHHALSPLFPPQHTVLLSLAAPLPPTSSPLLSTKALLKDILLALRQRCAPVRDPDINALLADLDSPHTLSPRIIDSHSVTPNPLAVLVISTLRSLLTLAETLKHDLTNALLGVMSEVQLSDLIRQQARAKERELILNGEIWTTYNQASVPPSSIDALTVEWSKWLKSNHYTLENDNDTNWISRLMQALASPVPVSCQPPNTSANSLPPQFFFTRPSLLYIQNFLQALVIAASLGSLLRFPTHSAPHSVLDFMSRIWSLLQAEIDRDEYMIKGPNTDGPRRDDPGKMESKIINLADEVIRARRMFSFPPTTEEEHDLRAAVERTLRLTDPVFVLLQRRLMCALEERVRETSRRDVGETRGKGIGVPDKMTAGIGTIGIAASDNAKHGPLIPTRGAMVKGFEDEVLATKFEEVVQNVVRCTRWMEDVWGDMILV